RWSPEQFAKVADQLQQDLKAEIVLVGGKNDDTETVKAAMQTPMTDLTGKTTLAELAGVIQGADLFIGAESGVMHLAAASGTPVVAIFGPGNPDAWGPWTPNGKQIIVRSAPECSPCSYVGHGIGLREGCEARTCIKMVSTAQVVAAAKKLLNESDVVNTKVHSRAPLSTNVIDSSTKPLPLESDSLRFPRRISILGLPVDAITYPEWLDLIGRWIRESDRPRHVCTTNPEFMIVARKDPNFWNILQRCDLCVPDGIGLLYAAKLMGTPLPERVTGSDGVPIIAERAAQADWRLFLLGAAPGIAAKTAEILQTRYPGLQIAGIHSGSPAPNEEDAIVDLINASRADILLVAYGAPQQDKWIARNLPRLQVKMAMGVGGSFDFIAGIIPRAPLWMRRAGLEWVYRLYLQPSRIGRMMRLPRFALLVVWSRIRR
ncbi:MAG TPA: WecB/TagA/CpsF family glycosyltransferase, partial [Phototrophicaceae bacterium]|nr:WecB/TagA/CpsF family glycosyltransferase [Phototrophicaceae bacterium]